MKVLVSGSTGFIGSALLPRLQARGDEVRRIVRSRPAKDDVLLDAEAGRADTDGLAWAEGIVHLQGENVADGRWTKDKKKRLRESRIATTALLSRTLAGLPRPPRVLVSASAVGYFGDRGDEVLTEESGPGKGFLAELCRDWEAAADPARAKGIRVVHPRFGVVLAAHGGALAKMLPPFKMGVGGKIGSGKQWVPWIGLDDALAALERCLDDASLAGPVNVVAPNPVTNEQLSQALGRALGKPAGLGMPAFAARLALGEIADEALLASERAVPKRLEAAGLAFRQPTVDGAIQAALAADKKA